MFCYYYLFFVYDCVCVTTTNVQTGKPTILLLVKVCVFLFVG